MVENKTKALNIYKIENEKQLNVKKVIVVVLLFLAIIILCSIIKKEIEIIKQKKDFEQYEIQANILKQQDKEREERLQKEKEEQRLKRMPKLTQKRKR